VEQPAPVAAVPVGAPAAADASAMAAALTTRAGSWFAGLDPHGWRTTRAVAAIMIVTVLGANLVNAAVPLPANPIPVDPGPAIPAGPGPDPGGPGPAPVDRGPVAPGAGVQVGSLVVVFPPGGWTVVGSEASQVVLQKAGVILIVIGGPYQGTPQDLAAAYSSSFGEAMGQFSAGEPASARIGNGVPAVAFGYVGVSEGNQVDGAIMVGVASGTGVILNVLAPKGQLPAIADDVDSIVATLQVTPGGEG
jgi:hypothetical protein